MMSDTAVVLLDECLKVSGQLAAVPDDLHRHIVINVIHIAVIGLAVNDLVAVRPTLLSLSSLSSSSGTSSKMAVISISSVTDLSVRAGSLLPSLQRTNIQPSSATATTCVPSSPGRTDCSASPSMSPPP